MLISGGHILNRSIVLIDKNIHLRPNYFNRLSNSEGMQRPNYTTSSIYIKTIKLKTRMVFGQFKVDFFLTSVARLFHWQPLH